MKTEAKNRLENNNRFAVVVDDDKRIGALLNRWLEEDGWNCQWTPNATAALSAVETREPELLVTDICMPGHSGAWLLHRIVDTHPDTSIIMLTGNGNTRSAVDTLTAGASGYLLKPIERDDFVREVRKTMEQRSAKLERRRRTSRLERLVQKQSNEIRTAHEDTIRRLVMASAFRDEETGAHITRTGYYSEVIALAAGWTPADAETLRKAAPMHDVGKIGIPDSILRKRGRLTDDEYKVMKEHTTIGAHILSGSDSPILQLAQKIALSHHERWDGLGYPHGLSGGAIPEAARILSIADVYDALSHDRVYRKALPEEQVLCLLRHGSNTQFEPRLLAFFLNNLSTIKEIARANPDELFNDSGNAS